jgi:hypothetical protein
MANFVHLSTRQSVGFGTKCPLVQIIHSTNYVHAIIPPTDCKMPPMDCNNRRELDRAVSGIVYTPKGSPLQNIHARYFLFTFLRRVDETISAFFSHSVDGHLRKLRLLLGGWITNLKPTNIFQQWTTELHSTLIYGLKSDPWSLRLPFSLFLVMRPPGVKSVFQSRSFVHP